MKERWIEDLRERFADRKTPPPDGLWESIESAMAAKGVATQKHEGKRRPITVALWRAATAAACVAAVAGAGWLLMRNGGDTAVTNRLKEHYTMTANNDTPQPTATATEDRQYADTHAPASTNPEMATAYAISTAVDDDGRQEQTTPLDTRERTDTAVTAEQTTAEADGTRESVVIKRRPARTDAYKHGKGNNLLAALSDGDCYGSDKVAVALFGGGLATMGGSTGSGHAGFRASSLLQSDVTCNEIDKEYRLTAAAFDSNEQTEVRVRHRQPVRLGMSVRFKLGGRFGLETGMSYSYLSTDIASGDDSGGYDTDQKLHYVGIPLSVNYDIWSTDRVEIYASAGGAVDFCVSGKTHTDYVSGNIITSSSEESLRDKRPQWSVNASAGVQYNFNDILGIYAEPGVGYYFDNGSDVSTIFKEKPLNFNLNVGIRFTVR